MNLATTICFFGLAACLAALAAVKAWRICRDAWRKSAGRRGVLLCLAVLAAAATIRGGSKPEPRPKRDELVIVVEPLGDGMYSTHMLHMTKEDMNEIRNDLGL